MHQSEISVDCADRIDENDTWNWEMRIVCVVNNQIIFQSAHSKIPIFYYWLLSISYLKGLSVEEEKVNMENFPHALGSAECAFACYYNNLIRLLAHLSPVPIMHPSFGQEHMYYGNRITGFDYSYVLEYFCINLRGNFDSIFFHHHQC